MGFVYSDKVQMKSTGERAKVNRVWGDTIQIEFTNGELMQVSADEIERQPAAPPPAPASDDVPSRERLAAITARVAEYERQMKTRLSDADISPMDAEEAADMLGGLAYIKSEQIAALESALAAAESDRARLVAAVELIAQAADRHEKFYIAAGRPSRPIIHIEWGQVLSIAREALGRQTPTATADDANALADGGE